MFFFVGAHNFDVDYNFVSVSHSIPGFLVIFYSIIFVRSLRSFAQIQNSDPLVGKPTERQRRSYGGPLSVSSCVWVL